MSSLESQPSPAEPPLSRAQWLLLLVLAAIQFSHIVDFVIIMPLAPHLSDGLQLSSRQFGFVVSAYGWAAFISGLLLAPWLDRFDRKRTLLTLFAGFTLGTLLCAVAPDFAWLLVGRAIAGGCGGIMAASVLAIVGDAFPDYRRGMATGVIMSAFSISSIVGVPAGLFLADSSGYGWRAPFIALTIMSAALLILGIVAIPALRGHLRSADDVFKPSFWAVVSKPTHLKAFAVMLTLVFGGFLIIPYIADFLVKNVGLSRPELRMMYFFGGLATLVSMNVVGRLADRFSRLLLFRVIGLLALVTVVIITRLQPGTPVWVVLITTTLMMILMSGRMVPITAITTGIAPPRERGAFMSVMSSVQQFGAALAPLAAALLMRDTGPGEPLVGYDHAGVASVIVGLLALWLGGMLRPTPKVVTPSVEVVPEPASSHSSTDIAVAPGVSARA